MHLLYVHVLKIVLNVLFNFTQGSWGRSQSERAIMCGIKCWFVSSVRASQVIMVCVCVTHPLWTEIYGVHLIGFPYSLSREKPLIVLIKHIGRI